VVSTGRDCEDALWARTDDGSTGEH
jgi:hypothetical protein